VDVWDTPFEINELISDTQLGGYSEGGYIVSQ
jgi:hypothetical protein